MFLLKLALLALLIAPDEPPEPLKNSGREEKAIHCQPVPTHYWDADGEQG